LTTRLMIMAIMAMRSDDNGPVLEVTGGNTVSGTIGDLNLIQAWRSYAKHHDTREMPLPIHHFES
jgi:hypothetical protein